MTTTRFLRCMLFALLASFTGVTTAASTDLDEIPPPPIEWGKVPKEDLEMKTFPADTNASALILCDFGESKLNDDFNLVYTRHLRVKILNEKGFRWGTHSLTLYDDKEHGETIDDIEGITYTLNANGEIVEHELDEDEVFTEQVSENYKRYKFTLPSLQPGCVIEIRYKIAMPLSRVRDWTFQDDEPVRWSEYRLLHPAAIGFASVTHGYEKFTIDEQLDPKVYFSGAVAANYGSNMLNCRFSRWAMKDLPALRSEPFITTLDDYYCSVKLQLSGYALRGGGIERVLDTWEELVAELEKNQYIGGRIRQTGDIKDLAQKLTAGAASPLDKLKAIYAWVSGSIVWDGKERFSAEQTGDQVLESKKGNSAEINYLLVSLLRAAGLQADPIIVSTRSNGLVQVLYPLVQQFNYGMARVMIGGTQLFLDATDPARPYTMVRAQTVGVRALVIRDDEKVEWVAVQSNARSVSVAAANVTIDETGALKGTLEGSFKEYANINVRESLRKGKPVETVKEVFSIEASDFTIDSVAVRNQDSVGLPINISATISADAYGQAGEGLLYVNPHIVSRWKDNPFKSAERKFPVDYNYPREYVTYVNLTLPASYEIKDVFPNKSLNMDGQVKYTRELVIDHNQLQLVTRFEILNREIAPKNYKRLKELYSSMIQTESEQLVLKKKQPAAPAASAPSQAAPASTAKQASIRKK